MKQIYKPLKNNWLHNEITKDDIQDRVDSEDLYTWSKGYPLIKQEDIKTT